ncbi:PGAP1-like protein [Musa troglodytarum]|uniref:PGAP1-like protein n=1 Tax=Musa troglodytarum TaxID=320322 RepID=A0A9E7F6F5_9LILI|nr:PGAP1-like protein [Musa troglodytarum]
MWVRIIIGADHEFRAKLWSEFDPSTGLDNEDVHSQSEGRQHVEVRAVSVISFRVSALEFGDCW